MVTVQLNFIPQGGTDADRVNIPAHLVLFGKGKVDTTNNVIRVNDKSYKLDSLQFNPTEVPPAEVLPAEPNPQRNQPA